MLYHGYKAMDKNLIPYLNDIENILIKEKPFKVKGSLLDKIEKPKEEYTSQIGRVYAFPVATKRLGDVKENVSVGNEDTTTSIYLVVGKYIKKEFYTDTKFDTKTDYFFTSFLADEDKDKNSLKNFTRAKYILTQSEYKNWLSLNINNEILNDLSFLNKFKLIQKAYEACDNYNENADDNLPDEKLF